MPTTGPNIIKRGEKPPVMPVAATRHTAAGARAFAEFFIKTIDWGYATGSPAYLRHYSYPACVSCNSLIKGMNSDRKAGHRYIGGRTTVLGSKPGAHGPLRTQIVNTDSTAFEEVDRAGKFITADQAYHDQKFDLDLTWTGTGWLVTRFAVQQ